MENGADCGLLTSVLQKVTAHLTLCLSSHTCTHTHLTHLSLYIHPFSFSHAHKLSKDLYSILKSAVLSLPPSQHVSLQLQGSTRHIMEGLKSGEVTLHSITITEHSFKKNLCKTGFSLETFLPLCVCVMAVFFKLHSRQGNTTYQC